jgi:hypothetical protein
VQVSPSTINLFLIDSEILCFSEYLLEETIDPFYFFRNILQYLPLQDYTVNIPFFCDEQGTVSGAAKLARTFPTYLQFLSARSFHSLIW